MLALEVGFQIGIHLGRGTLRGWQYRGLEGKTMVNPEP